MTFSKIVSLGICVTREIICVLRNGIPFCSDLMTFILYPVTSASDSSTPASSGRIFQRRFAKCETRLSVFVSSVEDVCGSIIVRVHAFHGMIRSDIACERQSRIVRKNTKQLCPSVDKMLFKSEGFTFNGCTQ